MLNKIARSTIRRPNLIQGSLFNVTLRSFGVIVRSRPQDDIAELDENYKHGHVSKFVMRDFLKAGQKESVAFIEGTSTGRSYTYGELHRQGFAMLRNESAVNTARLQSGLSRIQEATNSLTAATEGRV